MEVVSEIDRNSHVVLGGGAALAFSIDDTSEMVTVLSDTLYRDKMTAVVREVMCNGWDSHINSGVNRPLRVEIFEDRIEFQDFGSGIPHDMIQQIYCIYGRSTKAKDVNQTGGFGLGSKAPFAYSTHFTVSNARDGKRVIYAISRGTIETNMKPAARPVAEIPTTDTGVMVTIPVSSESDARKFKDLAVQIAKRGNMWAKISHDHDLCEVKPASVSETGGTENFFIVNQRATTRFGSLSPVNVRIGAVIYPIDTDDAEVNRLCRQVHENLDGDYSIVALAEPGSLSMVPSREALSMTPRTKANLIALLTKVRAEMEIFTDKVADHFQASALVEFFKYNEKSSSSPFEQISSNMEGRFHSYGRRIIPQDLQVEGFDNQGICDGFCHVNAAIFFSRDYTRGHVLGRYMKKTGKSLDDMKLAYLRKNCPRYIAEFKWRLKHGKQTNSCSKNYKVGLRQNPKITVALAPYAENEKVYQSRWGDEFSTFDPRQIMGKRIRGVIVAPTKTIAKRAFNVLNRSNSFDRENVLILIRTKVEPDFKERVKAVLDKYGVHFEVKSPVVVKKKKTKEKLYRGLHDCVPIRSKNKDLTAVDDRATLANPKYFIAINLTAIEISSRYGSNSVLYERIWSVAKYFPEIAVVRGKREADALIAENPKAVHIRTAIAAWLNENRKKPEVGLAYELSNRTSHGYDNPLRMIFGEMRSEERIKMAKRFAKITINGEILSQALACFAYLNTANIEGELVDFHENDKFDNDKLVPPLSKALKTYYADRKKEFGWLEHFHHVTWNFEGAFEYILALCAHDKKVAAKKTATPEVKPEIKEEQE